MQLVLKGPPCFATIKGSRFIGWAARLPLEEDLPGRLAEARERWPEATHYTWAYRIAPGRERASDDGEPHGTAGLPMLHIIQKQEFVQTMVLVIRYFGGTKLGRGGLIQAYQSACLTALETAEKAPLIAVQRVTLVLDYTAYGALKHRLESAGLTIDARFSEHVVVDFECPSALWTTLGPSVIPLSRAVNATPATLQPRSE
jgi:uncharacterized YigZ family protein